MRPVERGAHPVDTQGAPRVFAKYGDARNALIERLGSFCSYCEMRIENAPNVEHVSPKSKDADREKDWLNFLLSCNHCNPTKGDRTIYREEYFWPDRDNTFRAFVYRVGGLVDPHPSLSVEERNRALRTRDLAGLNPVPGRSSTDANDRCWKHRSDAWDLAVQKREHLARMRSAELMDCIVDLARSRGYWSIWMTVFDGDPEMRQRLIDGFKGTARACFDVHGAPVARPGGAL